MKDQKLPLLLTTKIKLPSFVNKVDLEALVRSNVNCLKPEYIAGYLTDDPPPQPSQFFIPEVLPYYRSVNILEVYLPY